MTQKSFTIDAIVILPDHLHCIWQLPPGDDDYSTRWKMIKAHFSKQYKRRISGFGINSNVLTEISPTQSMRKKGETGLWQRRFWEHTIRDEKDYARHFDYIHYNPVKHGLTAAPAEWKYSSFHRYVHKGFYKPEWGITPPKELPDTIGE